MKITYIGSDPYRQIPTADNVTVTRGATVDIDDAVALTLLDQPDQWAKPKDKKE